MIQITDVRKSYSNGSLFSKWALDGVTLSLPRGEIVGLFGENGAGKTTLMKSILGFHGYKGEITLDGAPITHKNITKISFATCEHSFFPDVSPEVHREFYQGQFPTFLDKRYESLMDFFQLPRHKALRHYSTGQKNQFEVIMALSQGADYILMDEPFGGNDVFNREDFYKVLLGILKPEETVLLSTHLIEEVSQLVGRAILLSQGTVVGDASVLALEEEGKSLMQYIKETYHYQRDRVSRALDQLTEEGEL